MFSLSTLSASGTHICRLIATLVILAAAAAPAQTRQPAGTRVPKGPPASILAKAIRYQNGLLSVRINGLSLSHILAEIARQGNLKLLQSVARVLLLWSRLPLKS